MENIYMDGLNKRVIKSILEILILQLIKNEPMPGNKILKKINSKFNVLLSPATFYSALSYLKDEGLVNYSFDKMPALTKEGETVRKKLIRDFEGLQKEVKLILKAK